MVVCCIEFGRTPGVEYGTFNKSATVRDHHPRGFTIWLAGAEIRPGIHGATNELGFHAVENPHDVTVLHTTIYTSLCATKTPEVVLLDSNFTIRYQGRIDDQMRIDGTKPSASKEVLKEAIIDLLGDNPVRLAETETDGCFIQPVPKPTSSTATWTGEVGKIVHQKCAGWHREGTAAPFSLISHADLLANASTSADVVAKETMPPWYAARVHGQFQKDQRLTTGQ